MTLMAAPNSAKSASGEAAPIFSAQSAQADDRLLSFDDVQSRVRLSRTTIYDRINSKTFPEPVKIGSASRWLLSEIDAWMMALATSRRKGASCEQTAS
jgi:prophage regulatory protein